ncbi:MAG: hypothetical protein QOF55_2459 [Thermoleophilaceae bacterium]|nr:hypothetical protein [Thermoleophilaceae bacterium]
MKLTEAQNMANELAGLVAKEHRRANHERARREAAEAAASQLASQLAHGRANLEREREARRLAEAELHELLAPGLRQEPRFVPATRPPRTPLQRVL